jgi:glycosyltransferase involved in cell wall biosynthesis
MEAARRLNGRVVCRMVGPVGVSEAAAGELRRHVQVMGPVPRAEIVDQYAWADVFLLPSICEGSATVTYEALACGLPVVCTPNAGSVVRDGVDGFIVPVRDSKAIAERLEEVAARPELLERMSQQALDRAKGFTLARYRDRLIVTLKQVEMQSWNQASR